ncbi:MAG: integrase core domain-containing protein [Armatimonadota bacterium]
MFRNLAIITDCTKMLTWWLLSFFRSRQYLAAEIVALRSQLALYQLRQEKGIIPKPRCTPGFRLTWVFLMKTFAKWKDALCVVQPQTVIGWHRAGFQMFWRYKSRRKNGRPTVSAEMRKLIKKINIENPLWSPERIYDQLTELGFIPPSPNTIRKYLPKPTRDSGKSSQTWKTFIANHMDVTWAMDFFVVPTLTFRLIYVFIIVSHERREIVHFGITEHPTMLWVINQLRAATMDGIQPKFIIRDNDRIYGCGMPTFLRNCGIEEVKTAYHCPWQNPYCERVIGILRRELFDHIVPLNERHLHQLLREYIDEYYHSVRTRSSLGHRPPIVNPSVKKPQLSPDIPLIELYSYSTNCQVSISSRVNYSKIAHSPITHCSIRRSISPATGRVIPKSLSADAPKPENQPG